MAAPNNCFRVSETTCKAGQASVEPFNVVDRTSFCMLVIVMITCFCSCYQNIACAQTATQRATHFHDHREAIVAGTVTSCCPRGGPQAFQPGTLAPSFNVKSSYLPFNPSASCLCSATTSKGLDPSKAGLVLAAQSPSRPVLSSYLPFNPSASCLCSATTCKSSLAIAQPCLCVGLDCGPWTRSSAARLDVPRGYSWVRDRVARAGRTRSWPCHASGTQQRIFWPVHLHAHREAIVAGAVTSSPPHAFQPGTLAPSFNVKSSYLPFNPSASCLAVQRLVNHPWRSRNRAFVLDWIVDLGHEAQPLASMCNAMCLGAPVWTNIRLLSLPDAVRAPRPWVHVLVPSAPHTSFWFKCC